MEAEEVLDSPALNEVEALLHAEPEVIVAPPRGDGAQMDPETVRRQALMGRCWNYLKGQGYRAQELATIRDEEISAMAGQLAGELDLPNEKFSQIRDARGRPWSCAAPATLRNR